LEHYNILSLDGGGVRGLIAVQIMKHFELYAYKYSSCMEYTFPKYEGHPGVISMKDMFDMSAGTSTGSFIAAGLGFPKPDQKPGGTIPKFFIKDLIEMYTKEGGRILYKSDVQNYFLQGVIFILHLALWGFVGYKLGKYKFDNEKVLKEFDKMHVVIDNKRKSIKDEKTNQNNLLDVAKSGLKNVRNTIAKGFAH
jgi:patatin-like phospholipase/acyl hydrolase